MILTGNGKGKTTAAFGQALRAAGHGMRVCVIQFIKSLQNTGEAKALALLDDTIEMHTIGSGFTWASEASAVKKAAETGWDLAVDRINNNQIDLVILDEITYLLNDGILNQTELLQIIENRPSEMHIILTGRNAGSELIEAADLVTEMREIKHPYQNGAKAIKGIDF